MADIKNMVNRFVEIADNPGEYLKKYKEETGKKIIGCFPVYTPGELVHACGMLPAGIWGANGVEIEGAKQYFPAFCCSIMMSSIELAIKGAFDMMSGVIIPGMCDTLICMGQNWKDAKPEIPYIALVHPQNRKLASGIEYLTAEYERILKELSKISGKTPTEEELMNSIKVFNENRKALRDFDEALSKHAALLTNKERNAVIKAGYFLEKEEHTKMVKELTDLINKEKEDKGGFKRAIVSGIIFDHPGVLEILEENNMKIVGDDIGQESRQFRTDVPTDGKNALECLAMQWRDIEGCSLAFDPKKLRGQMIGDLAKKREADGVIYALMKFCDPEEYDLPRTVKDIKEAGMPVISFEVDQESGSLEQIRTRIQTFAEIL